MKQAFMLFLLLLCGFFGRSQSLETFHAKLDQVNMVFNMPEGFHEVPVAGNDVMEYDYAIALDDTLEIRYAIRPITLKEYESEEQKAIFEEMAPTENSAYLLQFMTVILNLTGGHETKIVETQPDLTWSLYHADWAANTWLRPVSSFTDIYEYCEMRVIHRKNRSTSYIFYLSNSPTINVLYGARTSGSLMFK